MVQTGFTGDKISYAFILLFMMAVINFTVVGAGAGAGVCCSYCSSYCVSMTFIQIRLILLPLIDVWVVLRVTILTFDSY